MCPLRDPSCLHTVLKLIPMYRPATQVYAEDPSAHLMSIHNNAFLYNYSQPWISHFSVQHTHNKPQDLWSLYSRKPFVWDEVKYEGELPSCSPQFCH